MPYITNTYDEQPNNGDEGKLYAFIILVGFIGMLVIGYIMHSNIW